MTGLGRLGKNGSRSNDAVGMAHEVQWNQNACMEAATIKHGVEPSIAVWQQGCGLPIEMRSKTDFSSSEAKQVALRPGYGETKGY